MKTTLAICLAIISLPAFAANHYIRDGGTGDGSAWNNALDVLPSTLVRGDTYYIADGDYAAYTFNNVSGTTLITIKKATASDHGTETGWLSSYGDGQAIFNSSSGGCWTIDCDYLFINGQHSNSVPTKTGHGIKLNYTGTGVWSGIIAIGGSRAVNHVTIDGVHSYSQNRAATGNYAIRNLRVASAYSSQYIACYNCYFDGSGQDGIVLTDYYTLFDHCYMLQLGELHTHASEAPVDGIDNHGQSIYGAGCFEAIFRFCIFERCEGQSLWAIDDASAGAIRFYGNVIFNTASSRGAGFRSSGGVFETPYQASETCPNVFIYNNTYARIGYGSSDYCRFWNAAGATPIYLYNNLEYGCTNTSVINTWTGVGYFAVGGGQAPGQANEQTGLASSIFTDYANNDFTLTGGTTAGLAITSQGWWSGGADAFFGSKDMNVDMLGNVRGNDGTLDRGAFEFVADLDPAAPTINTQPTSQTNIVGGTVTFLVAASGNPAPSYQWSWYGTNVSGATSSSWTSPVLVSGNNGSQTYCYLSNTEGNVYSTTNYVGVTNGVAPSISANPQNDSVPEGSSATFTVTASGGSLSYQWRLGGASISGATTSSYTTNSVVLAADQSEYDVVVTNTWGATTSTVATLTVTEFSGWTVGNTWITEAITQMTNQVSFGFSVYPGAVNADLTVGFSPSAVDAYTDMACIVLFNDEGRVQVRNGSSYGAATSFQYLANNWYVVTGLINIPAHTYSVGINGTNLATDYVFRTEQAAASELDNIGMTDTIATDLVSNLVWEVNGCTSPTVTVPPQNTTRTVGQNATFTVTATGTSPMTYQWKLGGANISGATTTSYTTNSVVLSANGSQYTVGVTNACGGAVSSAATLTVTGSAPGRLRVVNGSGKLKIVSP